MEFHFFEEMVFTEIGDIEDLPMTEAETGRSWVVNLVGLRTELVLRLLSGI